MTHPNVDRGGDGGDDGLFRVTALPSCACGAGTASCLTTVDQWLLIGTVDGRLFFHHVLSPSAPPSPASELSTTLVHTHALSPAVSITQVIFLRDCQLLVVRARDAVLVYRVPAPLLSTSYRPDPHASQSRGAPGSMTLTLVAQLPALVELLSIHVRKQRQLYTLALLHHRKLALYDLRDVSVNELGASAQSVRLSPTRQVPLPDGVRCFEWCGKNAILGFRRSYVYVQLSSGTTEELGAVGKSAEPFLRSMQPVPEVLVSHDGVCQRTLADGTAAPGQSAFAWTPPATSGTARASTAYSHPFLCTFTMRAGGAAHSTAVELRMPLLTTVPSAAQSTPSTVEVGGPALRLPCAQVACCSHDGLGAVVDLDARDRAATSSGADSSAAVPRFSLEDGVAVASDQGDVFFLMPAPLRRQSMQLASRYGYQAAELLCDLCAARATADDRQLVRTLAAIESFAAGHYQAAMQQLRHADASPIVAIALFGPRLAAASSPRPETAPRRAALLASLPAEVQRALEKQSTAPLPSTGATTPHSDLVALQGFLLSSRVPLRREVTGGHNESLLRCVDTALVQSYALTGSGGEEAILDLLHDPHWCDPQETAQCLLEHGLWMAAAALWRGGGDLEKPLELFRWLATEGRVPSATTWPPPPNTTTAAGPRVPRTIFEAMRCAAAQGAAGSSDTSSHCGDASALIECGAPTSTQLQELIASATTPEVQACVLGKGHPTTSWPLHLSGVVCALAYVHGLSWSVEAHVSVLRTHASWLLGTAPAAWWRVALLGTPRNAQQYERLLSVVRTSFDPRQGWRSALEVETALLFAVVEDERLHCTDAAVHNACWKSAALLVFTTNPSSSPDGATTTSSVDMDHARAHLDRFLAQSVAMDVAAATSFFEAAELRQAAALERSILYQRLGNHDAAMRLFLYEQQSVSAATQYALRVRQARAGDGEAFGVLLRLLAHPPDSEDAPRTDEILHILRTCEGVDVADALPLLPDTLSMAEIGPLLLRGLRNAITETNRESLYTATLSARKGRRQQRWIADSATSFVVGAESMCAVCLRPLRAESVFLRYPNGVLAHPTCVVDEHVCPVTHVDFSRTLTATLLDDEL